MIRSLILCGLLGLTFSACSNDKKEGQQVGSEMKCGAGKCGANMFDGNLALAKKKKNILSQMDSEDERKECVINASSTKVLYDCVRSPITNKLSRKCGNASETMKCGTGKCGSMK